MSFPTGGTSQPVTILVGPGGNSPSPSFNATRYVDVESVRIEESGSRETATFECDVLDEGLAFLNAVIGPEGKILVSINGQQMFRGYVRQPRARWSGIARHMTLTAYDIGTLLDKLVIYPRHKRIADERDKARIQWLLTTYGQPFLNDGAGSGAGFSKIQVLASSALPDQWFQNMTLRQAIEQVLGAASNSSNYYVDNLGRLHTFDDDFPEADTAPYEINVAVSPGSGEVAPDDLEIEWDTSNLVNFWVVRGKNAVSVYSDNDSIQTYGLRQSYIDAPDADTETKRARVGRAALRDTKNPVARGSFSVMGARAYNGTSRWNAGQKVTVTSAAHGITDQVYRITRNTISLVNGLGDIQNEIEFGGNRRPFRISSGSGAASTGTALAGASLMSPTAQSVSGAFSAIRLSDDAGSGVVTTNMDPLRVDIDPHTGVDAPSMTDVGFGAPFRRLVHTNILNGDFASPPTNGVDTFIVSDSKDAGYNPLPGWVWSPNQYVAGQTAKVITNTSAASGRSLQVTESPAGIHIYDGDSGLYQLAPVPASQGRQYRCLFSAYLDSGAGAIFWWVFMKADGSTLIGSWQSLGMSAGSETKVDIGLVPSNAAYLWVWFEFPANDTYSLYEARCAFIPAETSVGLASLTSNSSVTTTEIVVAYVWQPENAWAVGSTYRLRVVGTVSDGGVARTVTAKARVRDPDNIETAIVTHAMTTTGSATNDGFVWECQFTVRSVGASGTVMGHAFFVGGTQPFSVVASHTDATSTVTIDTTVANWLEITLQTSNAGCTVVARQATIECIVAS